MTDEEKAEEYCNAEVPFDTFLGCIIGIICVIGVSVVKFGLNYNISDVFLIISYLLCLLPIGIYVFFIEK